MTHLLLDTCVWLEMAKTRKGEKILSIIEEFIDYEIISLILPEIVIDEFKKNKTRIILDINKGLSIHFEKVNDLFLKHGNQENKEIILTELNNLKHKIPTFGASVTDCIERIESLFAKSKIIKITDSIKLKAAQRGIEKKAPFHLSKNSISDAIIIESYIDYSIITKSGKTETMFISENKNDFSVKNGNQKLPHEDLAQYFDSKTSHYFIDILEALKKVNPAFFFEQVSDDFDIQQRSFSEIFAVYRELENKIWYHEFKIVEEQIQLGNVKLVEKKYFNDNKLIPTLIKEIWNVEIESSKYVEEEFGKENLICTDFEFGVMKGKLSTINWINGDDWDL